MAAKENHRQGEPPRYLGQPDLLAIMVRQFQIWKSSSDFLVHETSY